MHTRLHAVALQQVQAYESILLATFCKVNPKSTTRSTDNPSPIALFRRRNAVQQMGMAGIAAPCSCWSVLPRLMQQCTAMLRERMGSDTGALQQTAAGGAPRPSSSTALACAPSTPTSLMRREDRAPSSPPDTALEAMGPVLESVLGSLTQVSPAASAFMMLSLADAQKM